MANFIVVFSEIAQPNPTFSNHHPDQSAHIDTEKNVSKDSDVFGTHFTTFLLKLHITMKIHLFMKSFIFNEIETKC